ncbi:MAG TPA: ROK family protein [Blastocatellia bacterium]|nr:ROK family protein [Blastocatellia bacterium]
MTTRKTAARTARKPKRAAKKSAKPVAKSVRTLAVDIGGTGIKTIVLDDTGKAVTERIREETPQPATPDAIVDMIAGQASKHGSFDRVSVGFPGVVHAGVVATAPNLDSSWAGFDLASTLGSRLKKATRVLNDADVQGFAAIKGKGVELVITLGTGLGSAIYLDGRLVPNLELAHHPFRNGKTYEECVGNAALKKLGKKRWNKNVQRAVRELNKAINYNAIYIGGGNAKKLTGALPPLATVIDNTAGLLGGIALWRYA